MTHWTTTRTGFINKRDYTNFSLIETKTYEGNEVKLVSLRTEKKANSKEELEKWQIDQ